MSTTVLLGLTSFEKIGGQWIFGGASDFSNLLAPRASGSRSLMLRAGFAGAETTSHCESDGLSRGNIPATISEPETTTVKGALEAG